MARLPIPGSDISSWGEILNEFLRVEHNEDGSLKLSAAVEQKYVLPDTGIPKSHLATDVQASLATADASVQALADQQTATQTALDAKQSVIPTGTITQYYRGDKTWQTLDKQAVGLGNVTNHAQLPLTGGTLTGNLLLHGGSTLRAYHTDNTKFVEVKADQFWSRINAGGTSGLVLTGATVQMDASGSIVTYTPTMRPNTNLGTNIGMTTHYYNNVFAQRHYFNSSAYIDGATAGVLGIADGANIGLGAVTGTKIGTTISQKLGFYGVAPVAQQTGGSLLAGSTFTANEQLMLNRIWQALRNLGLID